MTDASEVTVDADRAPEVALPPPADPLGDAQADIAAQLVEQAQDRGIDLVGLGGLLAELTKWVLEVDQMVNDGACA